MEVGQEDCQSKEAHLSLTQTQLDKKAVYEAQLKRDKAKARNVSTGRESLSGGQRFLLRHSVASVAETIALWMDKAQNSPGPKHKAVALMVQLKPLELSALTCRCVLNGISTQRTFASASFELGRLVEHEARLKESPSKEWNSIKRRMKLRKGHRHKMQTAFRGMKNKTSAWSVVEKGTIGGVLIELFIKSTGLCEVVTTRIDKTRTNYIVASKSCCEWMKEFEGTDALRPLMLPRVEAGSDPNVFWVKCRSKKQEALYKNQPQSVRDCVQAMQQVAWRINTNVLDVLDTYYKNGLEIKGEPVNCQKEVVKENLDALTPEQAKKRIKGMWRSHTYNVWNRARGYFITQQILLAKELKGQPYYLPVQLDFRGRVYYLPTHIGPQRDDISKALGEFNEAVPLTKEGLYWFKVAGSSHFGCDKVSYEERVAWAEMNDSNIRKVVADPYGCKWWHEADEPWQFLRWCFAWVKGAERFPVCLDATSNGLQILSLLTGDAETATLTNVLPSDVPKDIYGFIASKIEHKLLGTPGEMASFWLHQGCNRKLVKRPVMTIPYGVSRYGMSQQLMEQTNCSILQGLYMADLIIQVLGELVQAPQETMAWLKNLVQPATDSGCPMVWSSPSGFPVYQPYFVGRSKSIKLRIGDTIRYINMTHKITNKIDKEAQINSFAPNFIHSLDASLVHISVDRMSKQGIKNLFTIHDCFGCHASAVPTMRKVVAETMRDIFKQPILKALKEQVASSISQPTNFTSEPFYGGFPIDRITESPYIIK